MSVSPHDCIAHLLDAYRPASLLVIGAAPVPPGGHAGAVQIPAEDAAARMQNLGRFDLAIVSGLVEERTAQDAAAVLGRLKNLHTNRFLLLADPARSVLDHDALLALALAPYERLDDGRTAWRYDIDRYNPERPWNNAEDWANPQNFERLRW